MTSPLNLFGVPRFRPPRRSPGFEPLGMAIVYYFSRHRFRIFGIRNSAGAPFTLNVTINVSVPSLLLVSVQVTVIVCAPAERTMLATLHEVVPVAVPLPPALLLQWTELTAMSSEQVPASVVSGVAPML